MTSVSAEIKFVRNLGNFESVHIGVGVTDDVREGETTKQAFERVYSFVEARVTEKVEQIDEEAK